MNKQVVKELLQRRRCAKLTTAILDWCGRAASTGVAKLASRCLALIFSTRVLALWLIPVSKTSPCFPTVNWQSYIVNEACPKFVSTPIEHGGLGDQLERFVFSLHVATLLNASVLNDGFGRQSEHYTILERYSQPYQNVFRSLFGLRILSVHDVMSTYKPRTVILNYSAASKTGFYGPCNTHYIVSIWSCAHVRGDRGGQVDKWCPHTPGLASLAVESVRWQLRYSYLFENCAARVLESSRWGKPNSVNVVWHVRTGDLCMHCADASYFVRVLNLIKQVVRGCRINLMVISQDRLQVISDLGLQHIVGLLLPDTFEAILTSDFLVTTGSTLPIMIAAFSHPFNFVVLEESKHDAPYGSTHVFSSAFTVPMSNGTLLNAVDNNRMRSILLSSLHNKRKLRTVCQV